MQDEKLNALIYRIPKVAGDGDGIDKGEQELAEAIQRYGPRAIPLVLPYLKDSAYGVRYFTGFILRDISGLNESHLTPLLAAAKADEDGWLPPAIARIGTPRAIDFLAEALRRRKDAETQIGVAFRILGVKGVSALCRLVRTHAPKDDELSTAIVTIFGRLDDAAKRSAAAPLRSLAIETTLPLANRKTAIYALGALGEPARRFVPVLQELARRNPPTLGKAVQGALLAMNAPQAIPGLLAALRHKEGEPTIYRDISGLREGGRSAGPEMVRRLLHSNWDIRVSAARTVGFIVYTEAIPALIPLLENKDDWRLVRVVAESLGRLQATEAIRPLQKIVAQHWFPPVREAARTALYHIQRHKKYRVEGPDAHFPFIYFDYESIPNRPIPKEPPNVAGKRLPVPGGKLIGRNDGEWGGDLTLLRDDGTKEVLVGQNVVAVTPFGKKIAVITGLAHISCNFGDVYLLTQSDAGRWTVTRWRTLPGCPQWAAVRKELSGEVLRIACLGGTVDFTQEGVPNIR